MTSTERHRSHPSRSSTRQSTQITEFFPCYALQSDTMCLSSSRWTNIANVGYIGILRFHTSLAHLNLTCPKENLFMQGHYHDFRPGFMWSSEKGNDFPGLESSGRQCYAVVSLKLRVPLILHKPEIFFEK